MEAPQGKGINSVHTVTRKVHANKSLSVTALRYPERYRYGCSVTVEIFHNTATLATLEAGFYLQADQHRHRSGLAPHLAAGHGGTALVCADTAPSCQTTPCCPSWEDGEWKGAEKRFSCFPTVAK